MHESIKHMATAFMKQRAKRRRAYALFTALALVVSLMTTYLLVQPASAMTDDEFCMMQEHIHSEACCEVQPTCGYEESEGEEGHSHAEAGCISEKQSVLVCKEEEREAHSHEEACYSYVCGKSETEGHAHSEACYSDKQVKTCTNDAEDHEHSAECYTTEQKLSCGKDEAEAHAHEDGCIGLTCGKTITAGHVHGEACYEEQDVYTCGLEEKEAVPAHSHTEECYEEVLICGLEEHIHDDNGAQLTYSLRAGQAKGDYFQTRWNRDDGERIANIYYVGVFNNELVFHLNYSGINTLPNAKYEDGVGVVDIPVPGSGSLDLPNNNYRDYRTGTVSIANAEAATKYQIKDYRGAYVTDPISGTKVQDISYNRGDGGWFYDNGGWQKGIPGVDAHEDVVNVYLVYDIGAILHPVETVDSTSKGLYMYMFDYGNTYHDFEDWTEYHPGDTKEGMTTSTTQGDNVWYENFPNVTLSNGNTGSLSNYFSTIDGNAGRATSKTEANHLFLQSAYDKGGWFYYSSFETFAELGDDGTFTVYEELGSPGNTELDWEKDQYYFKRGNFMPYNSLNTGKISFRNLYNSEGAPLQSTDPRYNEPVYGLNEGNNYNFGMYTYGQFYQPKDALINGEQMIFEFTGDDDMWVYIDGVLVLDLGGIHDAQSGRINFTTGKVEWTDTETGQAPDWHETTIRNQFIAAGMEAGTVWDNEQTNTFADGGLHTIQIFYMERGYGASNLKMRLNLPTIPDGSLIVRKDVENYYDAQMKDLEYTMQVTGNGKPLKNEPYYIFPNEKETYTTDENGQFKLKHDQAAVFDGIQGGMDIVVTEVGVQPAPGESGRIDELYNVNYSATDSNGQPIESDGGAFVKMPAAGSASVVVTNSARFTKPLKVIKNFTVDGETNAAMPEGFEANFQLYQLADDGTTWNAVGAPVPYSKFTNGSFTYMLEENKTYAVAETVTYEGVTASGSKYIVTNVTTVDEETPTAAKPDEISGVVEMGPSATANPVGDTIAFENVYGVLVGDISIDKNVVVNGSSANTNAGTFNFDLKVISDSNAVSGTFNLVYTPANNELPTTVTLDSAGEGTLQIPAGSTVTIKNLPMGAIVTVTETDYDGYAPSWSTSENNAVNYSSAAQVEVKVDPVVIYFTNTTGTVLPNTGGIGTGAYVTVGTTLMIGASLVLMEQERRRRRSISE